MSSRRRSFALSTLFLLPALAVAQIGVDQPGYFPIEDLGILPPDSINLEINLTGPMMKLIALATEEEESDLSRLVEGLHSIRVRGSNLEDLRLEEVRSAMRGASDRLAAAGWSMMVRIRERDEEVYVFAKQQDNELVGLTVLSLEDAEAMLINLVGRIDPVGLSALANGLDLPRLEVPVPEENP